MRSFLLTGVVLVVMSGYASSPQAKFYTLSAGQPLERVQTAAPISISIDSVTVSELVALGMCWSMLAIRAY